MIHVCRCGGVMGKYAAGELKPPSTGMWTFIGWICVCFMIQGLHIQFLVLNRWHEILAVKFVWMNVSVLG